MQGGYAVDERCHALALRVALRGGDWTTLKALATAMNGASTTSTAMQRLSLREKEPLVSLSAEHGDHELTARWFETVLTESEQRRCVKTQRLALKAYGATGRRQKGEAVLAMLASHEPESLAVRLATIEFFGWRRRVGGARIADPSTTACSVWMQCLMGDARHEAALSVFDAMRESERDEVAHLSGLEACAKQKDAAALRRVKAIHLQLELATRRERGVLPAMLATAALDCYARCSDVDAAEALFVAMDEAQHSAMSVTAMMSAYALSGRHADCVRLFLETFDSESECGARTRALEADMVALPIGAELVLQLKGTQAQARTRRGAYWRSRRFGAI